MHLPSPARRILLVATPPATLPLAACVGDAGGPFEDHEEASDYDPVPADDGKADALSATFDDRLVIPDDFFVDVDAIDGDGLQQFFETSPYGRRSWLADAKVGDLRAADAIVAGARAEGINPLVMVARMQVEQSLVSKSAPPSQKKIDYAFGCGCPDNRPCNEAYRGLDKQIQCSAHTLARWYQGSIDGDAEWVAGRGRRTLDKIWVVPGNHATASLYAYTPWVLRGSGGNWLVWNVTRKMERHARALGVLVEPAVDPATDPTGDQ